MGDPGAGADRLGSAGLIPPPPLPGRAAAWRVACLTVLARSGLFDPAWYRAAAGLPDTAGDADLLVHYHDRGWRDGRRPNPYFDPAWYRGSHPDVAAGGDDPLLHYVSYGEAEGRRPIAWFDPAWYRQHHDVPDDLHALRHFLLHRTGGVVQAIPQFDPAWYLRRYPDVAAAGMDPLEHYLVQGFREDRDPAPGFDARWYRQRHLRGQKAGNPLVHALANPDLPTCPGTETTIPREVRRFTEPGPLHEALAPLPAGLQPAATVLAYYLPQFHPIAENDAWWGSGFTEWTNVARALPRFAGHYQPRSPGLLGHYRLDGAHVAATLARQIALARGGGIGGFIFHFYWFDGRRLLDAPLEAFLADPALDLPFCLHWANENWTRRWDGGESEVLIAQTYAPADEPALIATFARHFADPRYLRLSGRPLLLIYRPRLIPDAAATLARWRAAFAALGEAPLLVMAQSFGDDDPSAYGLDGATEYPPHGLTDGLARIDATLDVLDEDFSAQVFAYADLAEAALARPAPAYPLIRAAVPGWDNDARRQGRGMVLHGATPALYQRWLAGLIEQAVARPFHGTPIVCINAWNEWAEGAYLEPDRHHGAAFLNATARAVAGAGLPAPLLLVGHDAFPAGAQLILLHVAQLLRTNHGAAPHIALGGGGALLPRYQAVAPTTIAQDAAALAALVARLHRQGCRHALVNSAAAAWACPVLAGLGIAPLLLVHEMPGLIAERGLLPALRAAGCPIVYPAAAVRDAVAPLLPPGGTHILPQGVYQPVEAPAGARADWRRRLGVRAGGRLVLGVGYGDRRKGFDLFLAAFSLLTDPACHLAWAGAIDPALADACAPVLNAAAATGRFHLLGWQDDVAGPLAAADLFVLPSREDPYPSAALEALQAGLPVVAYAGSGGIAGLIAATGRGRVLPMADVPALADAMRDLPLGDRTPASLPGMDGYVASLLHLLDPASPRISVVVSCYAQQDQVAARLGSIFAQTQPLHSLHLHDDRSPDASVDRARAAAARAGRSLSIGVASVRAGTPFAAWRDLVAATTGDAVWIAEADDRCTPDFLAHLAAALRPPDVLFAFCDSRPVAPDGTTLPEDYTQLYRAAGGAGALAQDASHDGRDFAARFLCERNILVNVSAVLWRRAPLLAALERIGDLAEWQVAGDWRVYLELLTTTPGRVAHVARTLNLHCRAPATASARVPAARHLAEIDRIHALARARLPRRGLAAGQAAFRAEAAAWLARDTAPQRELPPDAVAV